MKYNLKNFLSYLKNYNGTKAITDYDTTISFMIDLSDNFIDYVSNVFGTGADAKLST